MDNHGFLALPFDVDSSEFKQRLDQGVKQWFYEKLDRELADYPEDYKEQVKMFFDPTTDSGRQNIFLDSKKFGNPWLVERIRFILQGDANMGLANMHKSWSRAGFGYWAHIFPALGMQLTIRAKQVLNSMGIACEINGLSHIIYKPPGGSELKSHHDQMSPEILLSNLEAHMSSDDPSVTAWCNKYGVQCLAHVDGGVQDGYTYSIAPMTPEKLLLCLKSVKDGKISGAIPGNKTINDWFQSESGPYFLNWKKCLPKFNNILNAAGLGPLEVCPMRPSSDHTGPFFVIWPKGLGIHGSAPNKKRRISCTLPLGKRQNTRFIERGIHLSNIANGITESEPFILNDTKPYNDGKTHKKPHLAAEWIRPGCPFNSIAPTTDDMKVFETVCYNNEV